MEDINILETLFSNPGLLHVAEHIVSYLDNKSVAQFRLVSKKFREYLVNIWRDRLLTEGKWLCQKKFKVYEIEPTESNSWTPSRQKIETSIFELWPNWKNALLEIKSTEDLNIVIFLLQQYFNPWEYNQKISDMGLRWSPLHFAAGHVSLFEKREPLLSLKIFQILLETSLDFNVCIQTGRTPMHNACQRGSKEVVELLLDNAVRKGIMVTAGTCDRYCQSPVGEAIRNTYDTSVVKLLFERRKEFDFHLCYNNLDRALSNAGPYDLVWSKGNLGVEIFEMVLKWSIEKGVQLDTVTTEEYGREGGILNDACEFYHKAALIILQSHEKYGLDKSVLASMALTPAWKLDDRNVGYVLPMDSVKRSIAEKVEFSRFLGKEDEIIKETELLGQKLIHELEKYTLYAFDMDQE